MFEISLGVFETVVGGLVVAVIVAAFSHSRTHSLRRAVAVGLGTALIGMVGLTMILNLLDHNSDGTAPTASAPTNSESDQDGDLVPDALDLCQDEAGSAEREGCPEPSDLDEDGTPDVTDVCPDEPGIDDSEGCPEPPDADSDGVPDERDRCPSVPASTVDGCRPKPQETDVETLANEGRAEWSSGIEFTEMSVGGFRDPGGIQMQVGGSSTAELEIAANREFQTIRGRVGITSQPCSSGSWARVSVKDGEGRVLWPIGRSSAEVRGEAVPFKARIASVDSVVLYAEGQEATRTTCGLSGTSVGWINTRAIALG